jgi:hypothetical protein
MVFQGSPNPVLQQVTIQESTDIRKRMHSVVALVGRILASPKILVPSTTKRCPSTLGSRQDLEEYIEK